MCHRYVRVLYVESMLPTFSHHSLLCSFSKEFEAWVGHSLVFLTLHVGHSQYLYWVVHIMIKGLCTLWLSPSTLYNFIEYLMLYDGGFLNSLLLADSILSTSDNLLWDRILESLECLQTYIHQRYILLPSTVLGIHQCPLIDGLFQVFDLNTSIHTCIRIWMPFISSSG